MKRAATILVVDDNPTRADRSEAGRHARRLLTCAFALVVATGATARAGAPLPSEIDVSMVVGGQLTRFRLDEGRLRMWVPPDELVLDRALGKGERQRLARAAERALEDQDTELDCVEGRESKIFVSVTVNGRLQYTMLCDDSARRGRGARWRSLLAVLDELGAIGRNGGRRDGGQ